MRGVLCCVRIPHRMMGGEVPSVYVLSVLSHAELPSLRSFGSAVSQTAGSPRLHASTLARACTGYRYTYSPCGVPCLLYSYVRGGRTHTRTLTRVDM